MSGRLSSRRGFLRALIGGGALLGAGRVDGALADKNLNHGDKATFQSSCKQYGGEFIDSPKDKLTACIWSDGSKTVCDANGNDCENYPPPKPKPVVNGGVADPFGGLAGVATAEITESVGSQTAVGVTPVLAEEETGNNGKSRKRGRRGKRGKK